jgi:asparagine synthase (glutamine-hydrolysing)
MLANAASSYRRVQLFKSLLGAALPPGIKAALRPAKKPDWLNDDWFQERKTATRNGDGERATHLRIQLVRELRELSLPHILHFEERATEAHLVRGCSPFLAAEVVEFALSLPPELLTGGNGYKKSILRAAGRDLLPDAILESRERMGFPVPADEWLRSLTGWASEELPSIQALPFIHGPRVQQLWESFRRSNGSNWQRAIEIWRLIFVARWARVCRAEF